MTACTKQQRKTKQIQIHTVTITNHYTFNYINNMQTNHPHTT